MLLVAGVATRVLGQSFSAADVAGLAKIANDPKVVSAIAKELGGYAETARLLGCVPVPPLPVDRR